MEWSLERIVELGVLVLRVKLCRSLVVEVGDVSMKSDVLMILLSRGL